MYMEPLTVGQLKDGCVAGVGVAEAILSLWIMVVSVVSPLLSLVVVMGVLPAKEVSV